MDLWILNLGVSTSRLYLGFDLGVRKSGRPLDSGVRKSSRPLDSGMRKYVVLETLG